MQSFLHQLNTTNGLYDKLVFEQVLNFEESVKTCSLDLSTLQDAKYRVTINAVELMVYKSNEAVYRNMFAVVELFNHLDDGNDFAFLERQKCITIDAVDYKIDLLFFHRALERLVVIDLKLGKFKPEHEGQMLLYLRYLNKNERKEGEESPIGLILCSEGNTEHIEYLMLEESSIKVAQYFTQLPDKKILKEKLQKAIAIARENHNDKNE